MKTQEQIQNRIMTLKGFLENPDLADEIIMGTKQRARIRLKIDILNWVLEDDKTDENTKNS